MACLLILNCPFSICIVSNVPVCVCLCVCVPVCVCVFVLIMHSFCMSRRILGQFHQLGYAQLLPAQIPKVQKSCLSWLSFFALLGSAIVRDARKMLMKLTPSLTAALSPSSHLPFKTSRILNGHTTNWTNWFMHTNNQCPHHHVKNI